MRARTATLALLAGALAAPPLLAAGAARSAGPEARITPAQATTRDPAGAPPLAGTRWQLVDFQSMSDEIGTLRPADPSRYTLRLEADGTAALRLDCNRGRGTWTAEPAEGGDTGSFRFGPLATTRALCPPPSMGERIARDAEYVRGYRLEGSRLHLSLMADGGIQTWQRVAPVAFEERPDPAVEAALRAASPDYTAETVATSGREARYVWGRVDLDADGTDEVLALLMGSIFCGTGGCDLVLLDETADGYRALQTFPRSRLPILLAEETHAGWRDLIRPETGGGAPPTYVRHAFDGTRYVETERLPGDVTPEGTWLLTDEHSYATGHPLPPRSDAASDDAREDALVEGTDFHATGEVPCARYEGQPMRPCRFGVQRHGGGDAHVTVFWPDAGSRVLVFEKGVPVSSDAGAPPSATKESDLHLVRIGAERFEIVDAVVFGG